jgi:hypothetical protein
MRHLFWAMAICFMLVPALPAQQAPTLGPSRPSLESPSTLRTGNPRMLVKMHKVYIQWIDHNMSEKLADGLAHVPGLKVVDKEDQADAIVRGTCFDLRRLKRLDAEVYITDRVSRKAIWQDAIHVSFNPPDVAKAVDQAASEITAHLNASIRQASK